MPFLLNFILMVLQLSQRSAVSIARGGNNKHVTKFTIMVIADLGHICYMTEKDG
jgi:hypothetical protein